MRAVFYKELGYWDGDPASILPLTPARQCPTPSRTDWSGQVLAAGRTAIESGDYRRAVQVLHHAVFADPNVLVINFNFTDEGGDWHLWLRHGVLNARPGHSDRATLTLTGPKAALAGILLQPGNAKAVIENTCLSVQGDVTALDRLASVLDTSILTSIWPPLSWLVRATARPAPTRRVLPKVTT